MVRWTVRSMERGSRLGWAWWACVAALLAASACTFDGAALEERRCLDSVGCAEGEACLGGFCQQVGGKTPDVGRDPFGGGSDAGEDGDANVEDPCDGERANACGGCGPLEGIPGAACGECGDGLWRCELGDVVCDGATDKTLWYRDADGDGFGTDESLAACAVTGLFRVTVTGDCDDSNAEVHPNAAERCDGADDDCDGTPDDGVMNGCMGCDTLPETLGDACGADSSGEWVCAGRNSVRCEGANLNACGGTTTLGGDPGDSCGACGELVCDGAESVRCADPGANACGGCGALSTQPGTACGACGTRVCQGQDATRCDGDVANACGGCETLDHAPGTMCSACSRWACDPNDPDAVTCANLGANACGGCDVLPAQPDEACGPCGLDRWTCSGNSLICNGNTECDPLWTRVEPRTFMMGSPPEEPGRDNRAGAETLHQVTLTRPYLIYQIEVVQGLWEPLMGTSGTAYLNCPYCPVDDVTWIEAAQYANALSDFEGYERCYDIRTTGALNNRGVDWNTACLGYRLPTEAEWEAAARAGTTTATYLGPVRLADAAGCTIDQAGNVFQIAWTCADGVSTPQEVGAALPNALGLVDTSGNVAEWVWDGYANYPDGPVTDPTTAAQTRCESVSTDCFRVARGGSFRDGADKVRSASRERLDSRSRFGRVGFRLVRTLPQ